MLTDEQGVLAIIALQKTVGVDELAIRALNGWLRMTTEEKDQTEEAHRQVCGGFPEEVTDEV